VSTFGRLGVAVPSTVPIWKADLHETCRFVMLLELMGAAALALPLYLGLVELYRARHRGA